MEATRNEISIHITIYHTAKIFKVRSCLLESDFRELYYEYLPVADLLTEGVPGGKVVDVVDFSARCEIVATKEGFPGAS